VIVGSAWIAIVRDAGMGGAHHDEVIALMAAKGMQREWVRMVDAHEAPLHEIVPASQWQRFTRNFSPVPWSEIRKDVMSWDKHPPLAFWVMNHWLSLFTNAGNHQAVILIWLEMVLSAGVLGVTAYRCSGKSSIGMIAFSVFLAGNSAVFTSTWVRQYALFTLCFAMLMLGAAEIAKPGLTSRQFSAWCVVIGGSTLLGMMCQYTFSTMTAPIHLAILGMLVSRRLWTRVGMLLGAYAIAGSLFFYLLPGAVAHAAAVSAGLERKWQLQDALRGVARMYVPLPSTLPASVFAMLGVVALLGPLVIAAILLFRPARSTAIDDRADVRVPLAGMLGAGVLQFVMVTLGFFPGWATSENHMCAFWLLTVLAASVLLAEWPSKLRLAVVGLTLTLMIGMQSLYVWHTHRILPRVNTSYIASQRPDLVCVDNLARGFVLQITDVMTPEQLVLATSSSEISRRLRDGSLSEYHRILYLPMDSTVRDGEQQVVAAARSAGLRVNTLPVVHTGMYEAIMFESTGVAQ